MSLAPIQSIGLLYQRWLKLSPSVRRWALGISLSLVLGLSYKVLASPRQPSHRFVSAQELVSAELLDQAISENYINFTGSPLNRDAIEAYKFSSDRDLTFYIFNFKTPKLCGLAGCLYVVYTQDGTRVLNLFLHANLPEQIPLFQTRYQPGADHLCLIVHQPDPTADLLNPATVLSTQYCYQPIHAKFIAQVQYQQQIQPGDPASAKN